MTDVVDKATRSRMMSGIGAKNTRPEIYLRKGMHRLGFRFRLHLNDIPGKPDIALSKYRALILIQGCFWHGHDCRYFKLPKTNPDFWLKKITTNVVRDERNQLEQKQLGWRTLTVWECAIRQSMKSKPIFDVIELTAEWVCSNSLHATIDETGLLEK